MATNSTNRHGREGFARLPRSRGAISGFLLLALGVWGALMPFLGPVFNYAYSPDVAWEWTSARFWLQFLPGVAAAVGGLLLLSTANRLAALLGGYLAAAAGAWFVLGPIFGPWISGRSMSPGVPVGFGSHMVIEQIGLFYGLGVTILFLAGHALGRLTVRAGEPGTRAVQQPLGADPYPTETGRREQVAAEGTGARHARSA